MKQNKYDQPEFFAQYAAMARSTGGLEAAGEWHALRALLPDLKDKQVLDLGCGFGWHCRFARSDGARSVAGIDLSEKMLARAAALTDDPAITYRRMAIEDIDFPPASFDVAISSLALHYIARYDSVCRGVHHCLTDGGHFVLSMEHPIFTSREAQDWCTDESGNRRHWPVDDYLREGIRHTKWLAEDVVKYHRTVATCINTLITAGFRVGSVIEPEPSPELLARDPDARDELRRPMFLLIAAVKEAA